MNTSRQRPARQWCAIALALGFLGLTLVCCITSARWIGAPFPGFFVMANRVIPSVRLPHWPAVRSGSFYQHAVVAVNGQSVATAEELYALVRGAPPGTAFTYTLQKDGALSRITLPSLTFTLKDYLLIFVAYLFNGLAIALIGIGVWFLKPAIPASRALLLVGLAVGLFALTGADLYFTQWFFRVYAFSEAFLPASLVYLTLTFPVDYLHRCRPFLLALPSVLALILAVAFEAWLYQPAAFSFIHSLCEGYTGTAGLVFLGKVLWDYHTTDSYLIRQKIRVVCLGFLSGYAFPAALMLCSVVTGGRVPINYMAFSGLLFPLCLGYAIVKHDLFELDTLLKRGVYYLTLTATLALVYLALLAFLNLTLRSTDLARAPLFPLLFTLAAVLLLNPLKDHLQRGIDRVFFRLCYDAKKVLGMTGAALASTLQLDEILGLIWRTVGATLGVRQGIILLLAPDKKHYVAAYPRAGQAYHLPIEHALIQEVQKRGVVSWYDLTSGGFFPLEPLGPQLLIPLVFKQDLIGLMVLGNKESGTFFSADDWHFLSALANQSALSIANALSYQEIQELNAGLEKKVAERTRELAHTNMELHASLKQLEQAYRDLQRSQEHLVQAEKMAALGRLTAGIAHEMNTPLGASLTSLKLLHELVTEYQTSSNDPGVTPQDHQDIATEMGKLVHATRQWVEKAATHIRSLRLHTHNLQREEERDFSVLQTIEDVRLLLSHRLRLSQCTLSISGASPAPILHGDPGKLGQVLTNLIVNAIDAYQDAGKAGGEIRIEVQEDGSFLDIRVRDQGCGIPAANLARIFEAFFSTKPLGVGTGLGLCIVRDIVTNVFRGTMSVESVLGQGSVFLVRLPRGD
jgi:signal transduction histidine kinase